MNGPATAPALPAAPTTTLDRRDPSLWPDLTNIVTEDDTPVDNPRAEKQMRLLTEPLYASWPGPGNGQPFRVLANVGLFATPNRPPLVPDVMLGLDIRTPEDLMVKGNRSWFTWIVGKAPDATVEIVSNREGGEDTTKLEEYARIGVTYYVIFDPADILGRGVLRGFALREGEYGPIDSRWLPHVKLGLVLWRGKYEDVEEQWLRWCDVDGNLIPTGAERAAQETQARAAAEAQATTALVRANTAEQRAAEEQQARAAAEQRAEELAAKLRSLGVDPAK